MSHDRTSRRRAARAFRPSLDGQCLETRELLTSTAAALKEASYLLSHPSAKTAAKVQNPPTVSPKAPHYSGPVYNHGIAAVDTARGGASAIVAAPDGSRFRVSLSLADNQSGAGLTAETGSTATNVVPSTVTVPVGTVRVYPMPGGQVGIIVDGSTQYQQLTIDPLPTAQKKGFAHSFSYLAAGRTGILQIGSIQVNSGQIQAVLGFHSADLNGPLTIGGTGTVDRIAFNALNPGAAIGVGGTLNTLDIANSATLTAGAGVDIGGNLNLLNIGGNLTLGNGANFVVNKFVGLTPQPPKGTGSGSNILSLNQSTVGTNSSEVLPSVSANITGNVVIGPGSVLSIVSGVAGSSIVTTASGASAASASPFLIDGTLNVAAPTSLAIFNAGFTVIDSKFVVFGISNTLSANVSAIVARDGLILDNTQLLTSGAAVSGAVVFS